MTDYLDITPTELEGKVSVQLHQDVDAENPRTSFDHVGTLFIDDRNGDGLSDKDADLPARSRNRYADDIAVSARWIELHGGVAILIRFADYGSSGARIHESDADDANGLIWMDAAKIVDEWTNHGSPDPKAAALACLNSEIAELNDYLEGNVYGFVIETPDGETLDSCWGFYGETYATDEARRTAEHYAHQIDKRAAALTAARGWAFGLIVGSVV